MILTSLRFSESSTFKTSKLILNFVRLTECQGLPLDFPCNNLCDVVNELDIFVSAGVLDNKNALGFSHVQNQVFAK